MHELTLQTYFDGGWHDAAVLTFNSDYDTASLAYESGYGFDSLDDASFKAVSFNYPVSLFSSIHNEVWLYFLDDICPSGASEKHWVTTLGIKHLSGKEKRYQLLLHGAAAPIGNVRIKEAYELLLPAPNVVTRFSIDEVKDRASDFLTYANSRGAVVAGATGAGGEAPKVLVRMQSDERVWIDTYQDNNTCTDQHYLVKYPRGTRTSDDCDILRAEYHFYQELKDMGFETIDTSTMKLIEGTHYPSLWLPRFDVGLNRHGFIERYGIESVYSVLKKEAGSHLNHIEVIDGLIASSKQLVLENNCLFDEQQLVIDWVTRDLLNIVFSNVDNHCRNTAFIKRDNTICLAPIYDFAPMKVDPAGIARTTTWKTPMEIGGEYDFLAISQALQHHICPDRLLASLQQTSQQLLGLDERLKNRGVPKRILEYPAIGFRGLEDKFERWGLI